MSRNKFELIFTALLIPLDGLMIFLAFWTAFYIRFSGVYPFTSIMPKSEYLNWVLIVIPIWLIFFAFNKLYSFKKRPFAEELVSIFMAVSTGLAVIFAIFFFSRMMFFSRLIVLIAWILALIFVIVGRLIAKFVQKYLYFQGIGTRKILLIGTGKIAQKIIDEFSDRFLGYEIIGIIDGKKGQKYFRKIPIWGNRISALNKIVKKIKLDEIVLADPDFSEKKMNQLVEFCHDRRITFRYSPSVLEAENRNIDMDIWGNIPFLHLKRTPLDGWGRIIKRVVDIIGSIISLVICFPLFAIIPILIKLDSRGPIFFRQKRVGLDKNFIFLKFRTMKAGAQKKHKKMMKKYGLMFKLKNDPRVTQVGKWLRKTSLDELPQLINVLKGEMSLVGPRPPMPEEVVKYNHWQRKRLGVKPGITGLWQVSGRSNLSFSEWVKLDKYYIEHWSLSLDLQIIFRTFIVLINKVGAY